LASFVTAQLARGRLPKRAFTHLRSSTNSLARCVRICARSGGPLRQRWRRIALRCAACHGGVHCAPPRCAAPGCAGQCSAFRPCRGSR
jgi:hypothetical protein